MSARPWPAGPREEVIVVHRDYAGMVPLASALGAMRYHVTLSKSPVVLRAAARLARTNPAAMVVALEGRENIAEVRALLAAAAGVRCLLLVSHMPPPAALNRVVTDHGSVILPRDESPVVIASTLVALLARAERGAGA